MTPKEKAIEILSKINGQPIDAKTVKKAKSYAKHELKRNALVVADEALSELNQVDDLDNYVFMRKQFWEDVKQEISNF